MHPSLVQARFEEDLCGLTDELCQVRGWTVFSKEYPVLDVGFQSPQGRQLRLRLQCEDWNEQPPAIELLAWNGTYLDVIPTSSTNIFNGTNHRYTGRPFICMRGSREYHTHESHISDSWEQLKERPEFRLGEIVAQIWSAWIKANP